MKRRECDVGETWLESMEWDIGRTQGLLARVGFSPAPPPKGVETEHVKALREKLD